MVVLVSAASRHGATIEVAASIGATLHAAGHEVHVLTPGDIESITAFDAAVIGSAVYVGKWLDDAHDVLERCKPELRAIPVWLFASGPVGDPPKPDEEPAESERLVDLVHAREHRTFPGALDKQELGFGERAIMAPVRASDADYRPWAEIEAWACRSPRR